MRLLDEFGADCNSKSQPEQISALTECARTPKKINLLQVIGGLKGKKAVRPEEISETRKGDPRVEAEAIEALRTRARRPSQATIEK